MNHPGRIGLFNQYWVLMSIHHPIMLTGPLWWRNVPLTTTAVTKTAVISHWMPIADSQVETKTPVIVNQRPPGMKAQDGFFELEDLTDVTNPGGYFILEERISFLKLTSIIFMLAAIIYLIISMKTFPFIAILIGTTWGIYGFLRNFTKI